MFWFTCEVLHSLKATIVTLRVLTIELNSNPFVALITYNITCNLSNCEQKPEKVRTSTGFEPVTSRYRFRRSNQLSYEATDVGSWSFVSSNEPVKNGCEVIYEMCHILNCGFEIK